MDVNTDRQDMSRSSLDFYLQTSSPADARVHFITYLHAVFQQVKPVDVLECKFTEEDKEEIGIEHLLIGLKHWNLPSNSKQIKWKERQIDRNLAVEKIMIDFPLKNLKWTAKRVSV